MSPVLLIAGMTIVTYLPRVLPLVLRTRRDIPPWYRRAMRLVPITAVGALIIPGGLTAVGGEIRASGIGLLAATLLAITVRQAFLVVIGSVAAVVLSMLAGI